MPHSFDFVLTTIKKRLIVLLIVFKRKQYHNLLPLSSSEGRDLAQVSGDEELRPT